MTTGTKLQYPVVLSSFSPPFSSKIKRLIQKKAINIKHTLHVLRIATPNCPLPDPQNKPVATTKGTRVTDHSADLEAREVLGILRDSP